MWFAKRSFTGDTEETEAELSALGFTDYRYIHNEIAQLQVLIVANDETMLIAYQGSKEFMDWIANFYFLQRDGEEGVSGRVHQGFALALDSSGTRFSIQFRAFRAQVRRSGPAGTVWGPHWRPSPQPGLFRKVST